VKSLLLLQENHKTVGAGPQRRRFASAQNSTSAHFTRTSAHNRMLNNCITSVLGHFAVRTISCLFIFFFTFSAVSSPLFAQPLSQDAKVSLITVSPGAELYSSFGHNALWVSDPMQGIDKVYNYGTFDFRTEGFYIKFMRGTLPYQLSVSPMYYTMYGAQAENRSVTEQVLNLSQNQKQKLYDYLENNYLPQNRQYAYKFFYDNCATRLRDALKAACGDSLQYYNQPIGGTFEAKSYRSWMNSYLGNKPWARFGMNLGIGLPSDHVATPQEEMYLPNNLRAHADRAKIGGQKLVLQKNKLFEAPQPDIVSPPFYKLLLSPQIIFILLMGVFIRLTKYQQRREKISFIFDKIIFTVVGLAGWLLLLLWIATDHGVTNWNLHLLWAFPLHFPLIWFLGNPKHRNWVKKYVQLCLILLVIFCVGVIVSSLVLGMIIGQPIEAFFFIFGLFYRLNFLRKRV